MDRQKFKDKVYGEKNKGKSLRNKLMEKVYGRQTDEGDSNTLQAER